MGTLTLERARELMREKKSASRNQRTFWALIHESGEVRFRHLKRLSDEGWTREDAAQAVGMTLAGVRRSLLRHTGSTDWPIGGRA